MSMVPIGIALFLSLNWGGVSSAGQSGAKDQPEISAFETALRASGLSGPLPEAPSIRQPLAAQESAPPQQGYSRYAFRFKAMLSDASKLRWQDADVEGSFEMEDVPDIHRDRTIQNMRYKITLHPSPEHLPGYVLMSMDAGSQPDFYPPDPDWVDDHPGYAREGREGMDSLEFSIESRAHVTRDAKDTVLDFAVCTGSHAGFRGTKVLVQLAPECNKAMTRCSLRESSGIRHKYCGIGWVDRPAAFIFWSDQPFFIDKIGNF